MQERKTDAVGSMRRVLTARRAYTCLLFGSLGLGGCGIGKLEGGAEKAPKIAAPAKSSAVSDAYKKRMGKLAGLPRGGPGNGAAPKQKQTPPRDTTVAVANAATPTDTTQEKKGIKARFAAFFKNRPPRKKKAIAEQAPSKLRGRYAMSDSGDFFVPCNDTTRYGIQGTTEARYLMVEKLRFIVRGLKTPVYAVFTGIYVQPKPVAAAKSAPVTKGSTPTAGQAAVPVAAVVRKLIFVNKVDTMTTTFPSACRPPSGNRSAGG